MRKKATITLALLALGGAALVVPAVADSERRGDGERGRHGHHGRTMNILDTNNDGKITLDEIKAEQGRLLAAADVDGDGKLSVDEFRRRGRWFQRLHTTTLFDLLDADGDQVVTAEEIGKPSERWLTRYDENNDGGLEEEEMPRKRWHRRGGRR